MSLSSSPLRARTLRLSVTDRCNLRCRYCMPASGQSLDRQHDLPALERLEALTRWLVRHAGVNRIKLTGGEPLLRPGLAALVHSLTRLAELAEISMTTNATLLERHAVALREAGLARVNISLDTLDPHRFAALTRGGKLERSLRGLDAALAAGLYPVKLNAVLRRSSWRTDVPALLDLAASKGLEIRFIELMRTGTEAAWAEREQVRADEVRDWLGAQTPVLPLPTPVTAPARRSVIQWRGRDLAVGWITPRSKPFCASCNRLRLDARGALRRCLMDGAALPLLALFEEDPARAGHAMEAYLAGKSAPAAMESASAMSAIGG